MRQQTVHDSIANVGFWVAPKWQKDLHCARVPKVSEGDAD